MSVDDLSTTNPISNDISAQRRKKQANGEWLIHADIFNSDGAVGSDLLPICPFFSFEY